MQQVGQGRPVPALLAAPRPHLTLVQTAADPVGLLAAQPALTPGGETAPF